MDQVIIDMPEKDEYPPYRQIRVCMTKITALESARSAKRDLEEGITSLIRNFELRTLAPVLSVKVQVGTLKQGGTSWEVEVKL
jgi:hypothetical protein